MTVDLHSLPDDKFRELVDKEVRGQADSDIAKALRDPSLSARWALALKGMKKSVESQLGSKKADLEKIRPSSSDGEYAQKRADYMHWRAGALRFKSGVEDRLLEIRSHLLRVVPDMEPIKQERNEALFREQLLIRAIKDHKSMVTADFEQPSDADSILWKSIGLSEAG